MNTLLSVADASLHADTPAVIVMGSAGTPVRTLAFLRHPDEASAGLPARILISRTLNDVPARCSWLYGARPLRDAQGTVLSDATTVTALAGQTLSLHTADGDTTLTLSDAAGRPLWTRNAQGMDSTFTYEPADIAGRLLSVTEMARNGGERPTSRVREAFIYAPANVENQGRNLAGALVRHYDNAGYSSSISVSLTGQLLMTEQHLLPADAGLPDWQTSPQTEPPRTLTAAYDATGAPLTQTNAAGVTTVTTYDISGAIREIRMRYPTDKGTASGENSTEIITLKDILYRADGVVLSQVAGNGVTGTYEYDPVTQRLRRHTVQRPAGHPQGGLVISDLHYTYDPAGNILTLNEMATTRQWHRNQVTDGHRTYAYDTLYRLVSATGRERLADTARGPQTQLKVDGTGAGGEWFPYSETYTYDDGDNLVKTTHAGNAPWTRELTASGSSNRATEKDNGLSPDEGFLPGGLQKQLVGGRLLGWYADGQLRQVNPVTRAQQDADDTETYTYSDGGTRVRKIRTTQVSGGTQRYITTYAGGAETRQRHLNNGLQLDIVITEAGGVRLVEDRLTGEIHQRYSFADHLMSVSGETDGQGNLTSREEYYPYGGSAGADEEAEEIRDRTQRYSGKERDATGLYYYGWRYYQPEAGRWLSADPGGLIDGTNLFCFCRDNPVNWSDDSGLYPGSDYGVEPGENYKKLSDRKQKMVDMLISYTLSGSLGVFPSSASSWSKLGIPEITSYAKSAKIHDGHIPRFIGIAERESNRIQKSDVYSGERRKKEEKTEKAKRARARKEAAEANERKENQEWLGLSAIWSLNSGYKKIQDRSSSAFKASATISKLEYLNRDDRHWQKSWDGVWLTSAIRSVEAVNFKEIGDQMESILSYTAEPLRGVFYRGMSESEFAQWASGNYTTDRFVSVSSSYNSAKQFGDRVVTIENVTGRRIPNIYQNRNESEFLINRGAKFVVEREGGIWKARMRTPR
ncbi:hypothetical protein L8P35_17770 [Enterobacter cloacae]|uniref:RHS repeat-associated core domain-containing protein n=1 Tax=Enterobacter cloacae TaxID=550 RepID=UPI002006ACA1|nr:RHS repeat-associated core domain-containing protein [Enterobacter cloacae]MCK7318537.1 hypothetical protein [Enterobacter cloacae]